MSRPGLWSSEDGAALVEFACLLPLFLFILAGVVDYSFHIQQRMRVTEAAAMGAAYGSVGGKQQDTAGMRAAALAEQAGLTVAASAFWTCTVGGAHVGSGSTCADGTVPMQWVQVETTFVVNPLLAFPGIPESQQLHGLAVRRVARRP